MSWVQHQPQQQLREVTPASLLPNPIQRQSATSGSSGSGGVVGDSSLISTTLNTSKQQPIQQNTQHPIHLNNNQPTHQHWPQQNYLLQQNSTIMQPTHATSNPYSSVAPNKWQQQNVDISANTYHQQTANANNWQPSDLQVSATPLQQQQQQQQTSNYGGYFTQQPPHDNNFIQQHQQYNTETTAFNNYPQPATVTQPLQQPLQTSNTQQEYIDNKKEGWNDWNDWNDNSNINISSRTDQQQQESLPQEAHHNANIIDDSFNAETNENWQFSIDENINQLEQQRTQQRQQPPQQQILSSVPVDAPPPPQFYSQPQVPKALQQQPLHNTSEYAVQATTKPTSLPLVAAAIDITAPANSDHIPTPDVFNDNSNDIASAALTTASNNIPSPVYVSQAKPVSKPSRQYASPPGVTPTELPEASTLLPPHGFQNEASLVDHNSVLPLAQTQPTQQKHQQTSVTTPTPLSSIPAASSTVQTVQPLPALTPSFALPPPVGGNSAAAGNPFKRAGVAQHHRSSIIPASVPSQVTPMSSTNYVVPPPPADFANPIQEKVAENLEPDNSEIIHDNQEVISITTTAQSLTLPGGAPSTAAIITKPTPFPPPPNDERNQYLQTSHLSENPDEELNIEADNFPPPGLSRLVLGQPELAASQRMVTGTEVPSVVGNLNIDERQADGEDTTVEQPSAIIMTGGNSVSNIDITADRNLYMVPGGSTARNEQRVVTGVERIENPTPSQVINEQREIELDGENLEDQQQQLQQQQQPINTVINRNEPPLEGAAANSVPITLTATTPNTVDAYNAKDLSNISTGNDESDQLNDHRSYNKSKRKNEVPHEKNQEKQRKEKTRSLADRYESEGDSPEYPSDHERDRRRNYRENSVRSERDKERDLIDKKRRENRGSDYPNDREKVRGEKHYYKVEGGERTDGGGIERRPERRSQRHARYDVDSKYETEESTRHESTRKERRSGRGERDRSEREYDDYRRYHQNSQREGKRDVEDRKRRDIYVDDSDKRRRGGGGSKDYRDDYDTLERRNRREKHRVHDSREYEDYRKQSSRNARENDLDKEQRRDPRFDKRHAAIYNYQPATYGYDPYAYYYEQMARTNPQAYAEWYKKYYGHAAAAHGGSGDQLAINSTSGTDGRESVHSGRSSANNEKDRYTHAYISQANEYHRHLIHQQQLAANMSHTMNSTIMDEGAASQSNQNYIYGLSGARSTGNLSQIHANTSGYYAVTGTAGNIDVAYYARSDYADSRSGNLSLRDVDPISADPQRLTPCKFVNDHAVVSFSAGLLITVKPKYTPSGVSNIVKLLRLGANDGTRQFMQAFPGPLVRGLTHKKTIIEFCEEQIRLEPVNTTIYAKQLLPNNVEKYKASYTLMWNLLILLLRQNGMVVGTDIAELLLKNQTQFPYAPHSNQTPNTTASNSIKTNSKAESDSNEENENDSKASGDENAHVAAVSSNNIESPTSKLKSVTAAASAISEEEITAKFRNYLIYGNVNEAIDWATDNNLWGHALFLASKMDRRSHANVMMKFANKLSLNDPLQTLYQLMSGRTPSSVTSVQDEKWGDWRPHLSMILSNTSQKPELDRKAITTLGDSLFNRGDLYAAHFCYLMAQVGFGRYLESATQESTLQQCLPKLVLLGSSHYKTFKEFATNESIMMTEIYEYACSLNDEKFSLIEFQPYKYLFATRLLDCGYQLKALMYMEQISVHIQRDPSKFDPSFINKVYEFADRLKFYDPVLEKTLDDPQNADVNFNSSTHNIEDQKWLQLLRGLAVENQVDYGHSSNMNIVADVQNQNYQNQIDKQFAEINQKFSELNMQYNTNSNNIEPIELTTTDHLPQEQQIPAISESIDAYPQQPQLQHTTTTNPYDATLYTQEQQTGYIDNAPTEASEVVSPNNYIGYDQPYILSQQNQPPQSAYYDRTHQQQQLTQHNAAEINAQQSESYDYWARQTQQHHQPQENEANTRPTISMPNTKNSYDTDVNEQQGKNASTNMGKKSKNDKDNSKNSQTLSSNQNSGWFGGIWNKLSLKPKNQMILPDDKNPSIVWDPENKRWINTTDGDEAVEDALKPPPKMRDLVTQLQQLQPPPATSPQLQLQQQQPMPMPQQSPFEYNQYGNNLQPQQQLVPAALTAPSILNAAAATTQQSYSAIGANVGNPTATVLEPAKPPSLQSNMFKMQRNRTLKNSYVDVFNPSGAPMSKAAESVLAPAPPAAVPQGGFFIPGTMPSNNDTAGAYQQPAQQQQQEMSQDLPQFYNPNQFGGASSGSY